VEAEPITLTASGRLGEGFCGLCLQSSFGIGQADAGGDAFTLMITFNPVSPNASFIPEQSLFVYPFDAGTLALTLGTETVAFPISDVSGLVRESSFDPPVDQLLLGGLIFSPLGRRLSFGVVAIDLSGALLASGGWPTDLAAVLNAAPTRYAVLIDADRDIEDGAYDFGSQNQLVFTQTSALAPVPEPSTMLLLGAGVAVAGVRRWRQGRSGGRR
jgi:hypothetical protein